MLYLLDPGHRAKVGGARRVAFLIPYDPLRVSRKRSHVLCAACWWVLQLPTRQLSLALLGGCGLLCWPLLVTSLPAHGRGFAALCCGFPHNCRDVFFWRGLYGQRVRGQWEGVPCNRGEFWAAKILHIPQPATATTQATKAQTSRNKKAPSQAKAFSKAKTSPQAQEPTEAESCEAAASEALAQAKGASTKAQAKGVSAQAQAPRSDALQLPHRRGARASEVERPV